MNDQTHNTAQPTDPSVLQSRLGACTRMLRDARHLEHDTQLALADLLELLSRALTEPGALASPDLDRKSAQLHQALLADQDAGLLAAARHRLEEAAARAETEAPVTAGAIRKLIDALSSIGV